MPWNGGKVDYAVNYVVTPTDLNNIGEDLNYLREEAKTINGTTLFAEALSVEDNIYLPIADVLGNRKISFTVGGTERAYIDFVRHTSTGQLTQIDFVTMGLFGMRLTETQALELGGHLNPTTTPTSGTWTINQVIPRGQYNISMTGGAVSSDMRILQNGLQILRQTNVGTNGGGFYSDGTNTTITFAGTNNTVTYWKY